MPQSPYDGNHPVVHQIRAGESLSIIAGDYGFTSWKPIWLYNTKVRQVLGPNPDLVMPGTQLFIPRIREGYDNLIRKLRGLQQEVLGQADKLRYELEGAHHSHQASRVMFDFAGDVATLLGTVALKATNAARAAKTAANTTGRGKVAAQYLADVEAEKLAKELKGKLKDKAVNAVLTTADEDLGQAHKDLYVTQKKGVEAIRGVTLQGGKSFLDIADLLLDYVSVSNVADGMIAVAVGETPGQTYDKAVGHIQESARASLATLEQKVQSYSRERDLVYAPV